MAMRFLFKLREEKNDRTYFNSFQEKLNEFLFKSQCSTLDVNILAFKLQLTYLLFSQLLLLSSILWQSNFDLTK